MSGEERRAVARLELLDAQGALVRNGQGEPLWGTAFLTGKRTALTAYHVVADRRANDFALKAHRFELVFVRAGGVRVPIRAPSAALADRDLDAVLLELEHDAPPDVEPLVATADIAEHAPFSAWGFAGLNPVDGLELSGRVEDAAATVEGKPAIQLFSLQAAAPHARIAGLSGGPCWVDGRVVGIIRSYLERGGDAVGGTVYASPLAQLLARPTFAERIRVDPCAELPALPDDYAWPDEPFRDLLPFGPGDARVFFGRCAELSRLRRAIEDPASRLVLLYGQTGVGKSSLLHAGLVPRLGRAWDVRYARRDPALGMLDTFAALRAAPAGDRPRLFLLDQAEEIITRPLADPDRELTDLAFELARHAAAQPADRIVLGFRKEWLSEIERALSTQRVAKQAMALQPMGPAAVEEVVLGLERSAHMKERYQVEIERELAPHVSRVLCADRQSAIAPALQVLLTKLWKAAGERSRSPRRIGHALFEEVSRDGLGLGAILDQRLASISKGPGPRAQGLALDLLHLHVTKAGTSALVTRQQRAETYAERAAEAEATLRELVSAYLLVDAREDGERSAGDTALAHDALGPLVLSRFTASELPGQRARRILENRTGGEALDAHDLAVVEGGLPAMRVPTRSEHALIGASRKRLRRERWTRRGVLSALLLLGLLAAAGGVRAYLSSIDLAEQVHERAISQAALVFGDGLRTEQERGEPLSALRRLARAVALVPDDDPRLGEYITKLVHMTVSGPSRVTMVPAQSEILAASYANGRVAVLTLDNVLGIYRLDDHGAEGGIEAVELGSMPLDQPVRPETLTMDPAGQRVLVDGAAKAVLLEIQDGGRLRRVDLESEGRLYFAADGTSVIDRQKLRRRVVYAASGRGPASGAGETGAPSIGTTIETEEPVPTLRVRADRPYILRPVRGEKGGTDRWELVDAFSDEVRDSIVHPAGAHISARISSDAGTAITWAGSAGLVRWDLHGDRSEVVLTSPVHDALVSPNGRAIVAQTDNGFPMTTGAGEALAGATALWTRSGSVGLPACEPTYVSEWALWLGDDGELLCRAGGWVRGGPRGHSGFMRGTHTQTEAHVHDGVRDRPPVLQSVDVSGEYLLELWADGELRAWPLAAPHGTTLVPGTRTVDPDLERRRREQTSRDGRLRLDVEDALFVQDRQSSQVLLRLGDAASIDAEVFEELFTRATSVTVVPPSRSEQGRVELQRAAGELPVIAWKVGSHTLMRVGDSDVALPSSGGYDGYVLSSDGRYGAAIAIEDPSIRLWRNRAFPRLDGSRRGPEKAYWLSARERLPGTVQDAGFHEHDGALFLWTLLQDGTVRDHYVSEPFPKRPKWTAELPWLLGGAIGENGVVQVRPHTAASRRQSLQSFAEDPSYAARKILRGFFGAP